MPVFRFLFPTLIALLCVHAWPAHADMHEENPARFMSADVWPWAYLDEAGQPAGLLHLLAQRLSAVAGLPLENRVLPHQRLRYEFRLGHGDFAVLWENPDLHDFALPIGEVLRSDMLLVALAGSSRELSFDALAGRPVGYIRGTYYGEAFQEDQGMVKIAVNNLDQALYMLNVGRLDAFISSDVVLYHTFLAQGINPGGYRMRIQSHGYSGHLYMRREPSHPDQGPRIRAALETLRESGELAEIFRVPLISEP